VPNSAGSVCLARRGQTTPEARDRIVKSRTRACCWSHYPDSERPAPLSHFVQAAVLAQPYILDWFPFLQAVADFSVSRRHLCIVSHANLKVCDMSSAEEYNHMDEVVRNLWIGDIQSSKDVEGLKAHNICSVLTAMRGRVTIHEVGTCARDRLLAIRDFESLVPRH
jgi:hypothetical protein